MEYEIASSWGGGWGYEADQEGTTRANSSVAVKSSKDGYLSTYNGYVVAVYAIATACRNGFVSRWRSYLEGALATCRQATGIGYYSYDAALLRATATAAQNNGNVVDYSPAGAGWVQGADFSIIFIS